MTRKKLVIIGAGGHAVSVSNVARSAGYEVKKFVDENLEGQELQGVEIVSYAKELADGKISFAIGIGDKFCGRAFLNICLANCPLKDSHP